MSSIFSKQNPDLRLVWDATALNALMRDPLSYYWKYVLGYRSKGESIDLLWGKAWDKAMANYHQQRSRHPRKEALYRTIEAAIEREQAVGLDRVAAQSKKANKKNLSTLIRSIVWYDAELGDYELYEPKITQPTTLLHELEIKSPYGETYLMVSNFDQVVRLPGQAAELYVVERKTTTTTINDRFWLDYDPSVQINTYDWAANKEFGTSGVIIEAVQTGVGFSCFAHHKVSKTPQQRAHWEKCINFWIEFAEFLAMSGRWSDAMNLATQRWDNVTRDIERKSPVMWNGLLETEMERGAPWNPLDID